VPPPEDRTPNTCRENDGGRPNHKESRPTAPFASLLFAPVERHRTLKARQLALEESQILELGTASFAGLQVRATVLQPGRRELSSRVGFQISVREMSD
jgi:hypothetical protein